MIQRTKGKTAVVGWGRGMGHKGHMLLASAVIHQAKAINATPIFILSRTSLIDPNTGDLWSDTKKVRATKDDPLTPQEKLAIYQKTFPEMAKIFTVADGESGSLNDALANLAKQGFSNVVLVVGADQKAAFQYLVNPSKDGSIPYQQMGLQNLVVMSRQETQAPGSDIEGPRATPMRQVLLDPKVSDEQKFAVWRDAMPDALDDREVFDLMQRAQQRLGRAEQVAPPKTPKAKIKEFIQRVRPMLKEASLEKKLQVLKLLKESISEDGRSKDQRYTVYSFEIKKAFLTTGDLDQAQQEAIEWAMHDDIKVGIIDNRSSTYFFEIDGYNGAMEQLDSYEDDDLSETEEPYNLPQRHTMDYGMRKTMIHRLAKTTDYEINALSLASDEELTDLYKQVFPEQDVSEDYLDEK
jgi:hypothetical protein